MRLTAGICVHPLPSSPPHTPHTHTHPPEAPKRSEWVQRARSSIWKLSLLAPTPSFATPGVWLRDSPPACEVCATRARRRLHTRLSYCGCIYTLPCREITLSSSRRCMPRWRTRRREPPNRPVPSTSPSSCGVRARGRRTCLEVCARTHPTALGVPHSLSVHVLSEAPRLTRSVIRIQLRVTHLHSPTSQQPCLRRAG
jgi:hypothetical protein